MTRNIKDNIHVLFSFNNQFNMKRTRSQAQLPATPRKGGPQRKKIKKAWSGNVVYRPTAELKVTDTSVNQDCNTSGSFVLLHAPVPGNDYTNRIGRKTYIKSIAVRGQVELNPLTVIANIESCVPQTVRQIIFVDNQPNAAAPLVSDLLLSASALSHLNLNNRDRFTILRTRYGI